jgi:hypothetical protein
MFIAVISLAVLLLTVMVVVRRTRAVRPVAENVVSLDEFRSARLTRRIEAATASLQYPLSASGGGLPTASGGGLRTCRQPDGRLGRPARIEPA